MRRLGPFALVIILAGSTGLFAQKKNDGLKKAKDTTDRVREADPPKAEPSKKTAAEKTTEAREQTKRQDQANAHNSGRKTDLQTAPPPSPKK
jgi:hypothetical protein